MKATIRVRLVGGCVSDVEINGVPLLIGQNLQPICQTSADQPRDCGYTGLIEIDESLIVEALRHEPGSPPIFGDVS